MGRIEDEVRELITDTYGSVPKLADSIGLHPQTIYSALRNGLAGASVATAMPIAAALHIDPFRLADGVIEILPEKEPGYVNVPLLGSIAAGSPIEPITTSSRFPIPAELAKQYPDAFLLQVSGESMNRVLPDGCYALIKPCKRAESSNQLYAVAVGETDATIKHVRVLDNGLELIPDSTDPTFHSQVFDFADEGTESVTIIGQVVWFCPPLGWMESLSSNQPYKSA